MNVGKASGKIDNHEALSSHTSMCHHHLILALLLSALLKVEKMVQCSISSPGLGTDKDTGEQTIRRAARRERQFDIQPSLYTQTT